MSAWFRRRFMVIEWTAIRIVKGEGKTDLFHSSRRLVPHRNASLWLAGTGEKDNGYKC